MSNTQPPHPGNQPPKRTGLEHVPWGDVENDLYDIGLALEEAQIATADAEPWEEYSQRHGLGDEFSLSEDEIRALPVEGQLAFLGQLVRDVSLGLGMPPSRASENDYRIAPFLQRLMDDAGRA